MIKNLLLCNDKLNRKFITTMKKMGLNVKKFNDHYVINYYINFDNSESNMTYIKIIKNDKVDYADLAATLIMICNNDCLVKTLPKTITNCILVDSNESILKNFPKEILK